MSRGLTFTQAQVRRAVKGVESAGLRVRRVTVNPDGSITIDGENGPDAGENAKKTLETSWDDV